MKETLKNHTFPFVVFIISLILIILFFLVSLEQKKEKMVAYQKYLAAVAQVEKEQKDAEEKIYLMGKFNPALNENFVLIPTKYIIANENKIYLRKETWEGFLRMRDAAEKDGIELQIASATRNFDYQKKIWEDKWSGITIVNGENLNKSTPNELERAIKILEYSSAPGTSRHHWGTDIDINNANLAYFNTEKGEKEYAWLVQNATLFGFCQPYTLKGSDRPTGYNEEKWHWSYSPLSKIFLQEYKNLIHAEDITGFLGDKYVPDLNLINNYVLGINPDCF